MKMSIRIFVFSFGAALTGLWSAGADAQTGALGRAASSTASCGPLRAPLRPSIRPAPHSHMSALFPQTEKSPEHIAIRPAATALCGLATEPSLPSLHRAPQAAYCQEYTQSLRPRVSTQPGPSRGLTSTLAATSAALCATRTAPSRPSMPAAPQAIPKFSSSIPRG